MALLYEGAGKLCDLVNCGEFDFLPTYCNGCGGVFCRTHALRANHSCCSLDTKGDVTVVLSPPDVCRPTTDLVSAGGAPCSVCGVSAVTVASCSQCALMFCLDHRYHSMHAPQLEASGSSTRGSLMPIQAANKPLRLGICRNGSRGVAARLVVVTYSRSDGEEELDGPAPKAEVKEVNLSIEACIGRIAECAMSALFADRQNDSSAVFNGDVYKYIPGGGSARAFRLQLSDVVSNVVGPSDIIVMICRCRAPSVGGISTGSAPPQPEVVEDRSRSIVGIVEELFAGDIKFQLLKRSKKETTLATEVPIECTSGDSTAAVPVRDAEQCYDDSAAAAFPRPLLDMPFSHNRSKPRGLAALGRNVQPTLIAVFISTVAPLKEPSSVVGSLPAVPPFCMAIAASWSGGRVLDRILEESTLPALPWKMFDMKTQTPLSASVSGAWSNGQVLLVGLFEKFPLSLAREIFSIPNDPKRNAVMKVKAMKDCVVM